MGDTDKAVINIYFYSETKEICRLETVITSEKSKTEATYYKIVKETLWVKPQDSVTARKNLTDFSACEPVAVRKEEEFLSDDVSIIIAHNKKKKERMDIVSLLSFTNINVLPFADEIPVEVISFLDPTVEKLYFDKTENKTLIHLQFKDKKEIVLNNPMDLNLYLSSGTIKGIVAFTLAKEVLKSGGYLIMDEIENHFNIVDNLANILKRNDIKKSEAYQSGFLEGTTPMYEAYMRLKKSIANSI